jgi:hypothetical protein
MAKTLDELIKESGAQMGKGGHRGGGKGGNGKFGGHNGGKIRGAQHKEDRRDAPYKVTVNLNASPPAQKFVVKQQHKPVHQAPPSQPVPNFASYQHQSQPSQGSVPLSIFERVGSTATPKHPPRPSGTSVTISNLNSNITISDLSELCGTVGEVKSVEIDDPVPGSGGKKVSRVLFARRSDALSCVEKFHRLTLDGTAMDIKLTGENGRENPFSPVSVEAVSGLSKFDKPNKKAGMFGTALGSDDSEQDNNAAAAAGLFGAAPRHRHEPSFSITLNTQHAAHAEAKQHNARAPWTGHDDRTQQHDSRSQGHRQANYSSFVPDALLAGAGAGAGARRASGPRGGAKDGRRGRGGEGKGGRGGGKPSMSLEDLDAQMDAYLASK